MQKTQMHKTTKGIISIFLCLLMVLGTLTPSLSGLDFSVKASAADGDFDTMKNNLVNNAKSGNIGTFKSPDKSHTIDELVDDLQNDSTTNGMKFGELSAKYSAAVQVTGQSYYKSGEGQITSLTDHLAWTSVMAFHYIGMTDSETVGIASVNKATLGECIAKLIRFWVYYDYRDGATNPNWWYDDLAIPNFLGEVALLVWDKLDSATQTKVQTIVYRGCLSNSGASDPVKNATATNAVWLAYNSIKYAMLSEDAAAVSTAVSKLATAISAGSGEGIKSDGSFFQHGSRLYTGSYGLQLLKNAASSMLLLEDTSYAFTEEQLSDMTKMVLEGLQYLTIGTQIDPQAIGRDVSREDATDISYAISYLEKMLALDNLPNRVEVEAFYNSIKKNIRQNLGLKYFGTAEYITINNSDFYFAYRGADSGLYYAENLNGENILSYNSSYATTTTIAGTNVNFNDIQPVQDYAMIPGTTAVYEDDSALYNNHQGSNADDGAYTERKLNGVFGGDQYGDMAVSYAQAVNIDNNLNYTVACFATDKSAIILGANIYNTSGVAMNTTLQQEIAQTSTSPVITSNADGTKTVKHNGVKYTVYSSNGTLNSVVANKTGSWSRNKSSGGKESITKSVFTLSLNYSAASSTSPANYAYSVMSENTNESYTVIHNGSDYQAVVMPDGNVCAVFYTDSSFKYGSTTYSGVAGTCYNTSASGVSSVKESTSGSPQIAVPETIYLNPNNNKVFQYSVNDIIDADGNVTLEKNAADGTMKYYFALDGASGVSVSISGDDGTNNNAVMTSKELTAPTQNGNLWSGSYAASSCELGTALTAGTSARIKWTFNYTYSGHQCTKYAYTTVYAPYTTPVFAATRGNDKSDLQSSKYNTEAQTISWMTGVHSVASGTRAANTANFDPMKGVFAATTNTTQSSNTAGWITQNGGTYHTEVSSGGTGTLESFDNTVSENTYVQAQSPVATLYFDSSRIKNLNQIPNLNYQFRATYLAEGSSESVDDRYFAYMVKDVTSDFGSNAENYKTKSEETTGWDEYNSFKNSDYNGVLTSFTTYDDSGTNYKSHGTDLATLSGISGTFPILYNGIYNRSIDKSEIIAIKSLLRINVYFTATFWSTEYPTTVSNIIVLNTINVDKSQLRDAVRDAMCSEYTYANDSEFATAYKHAAYILGKPDAKQQEVSDAGSALSTAKDNLIASVSVETVEIETKAVSTEDGTVLNDNIATVSVGKNITVNPGEIDGYTYDHLGYYPAEPGENLFDAEGLVAGTKSYGGKGSGSITANSSDELVFTNTGSEESYYYRESDLINGNYYSIPVSAGKTYRLSYTATGVEPQVYVAYNNGTTNVSRSSINYGTGEQYIDITVGHNANNATFRFGNKVAGTTTFSNIKFYELSNKFSIEAFDRSPSCSVSGNGTTGISSISASKANGTITLTGSGADNYTAYPKTSGTDKSRNFYMLAVEQNKTYRFSYTAAGTTAKAMIMAVRADKSYLESIKTTTNIGNNVMEFTITNPEAAYVCFRFGNSTADTTTFSNLEFYEIQESNENPITINDISSDKFFYLYYTPKNYDLLLDNEFDFDNAGFTTASNSTIKSIDYSANSFTIKATGTSEVYVNPNSNPMVLEAGHTYKFSYDFSTTGSAGSRFTILTAGSDGNYYKDIAGKDKINYCENLASGDTFTIPSDRTNVVLRPGMTGTIAVDDEATYSNIRVQDVTEDTSIDTAATASVSYGKQVGIGTLPSASCNGYVFDGWYTGKNGTGTKYTSATVYSVSGNTKLYSNMRKICEIAYDNLFLFNDYIKTKSAEKDGTNNKVPFDKAAGTLTVASGLTKSDSGTDYYSIDVKENKKYCFEIDTSATGGTFYVFFDDGNVADTGYINNGVYVQNLSNFDRGADSTHHHAGVGLAQGNNKFYIASPEGATKMTIRFGSASGSEVTFGNIRIADEDHYYPTATYSAVRGTVTEQDEYTDIIEPERIGYTFDGWYPDYNVRVDGETGKVYYVGDAISNGEAVTLTENTTLYSKWTPNTYTVTFDKQSGTNGSNNVTATYDAAMPAITSPTRTGYAFTGYYDAASGGTKYYNAGGTSAKEWDKAENTTLYAQWTANSYKIYYDNLFNVDGWFATSSRKLNEATETYADYDADENEISFTTVATQSKSNNWAANGSGFYSIAVKPNTSYTLSADVSGTNVSIGYRPFSGTENSTKLSDNVLSPAKTDAATNPLLEYEFTTTATTNYITIVLQNNTTGTAKFKNVRLIETSVYNNIKDKGLFRDTVTYGDEYGTTILPNNLTATGYSFTGWKNASGDTVSSSTVHNTEGNIYVYSQWTINTYTAVAKAYSNTAKSATELNDYTESTVGGTASVAPSSANHGSNVTFTATPNNGYKFEGWFTSAALTGTAESTDASYTVALTAAKTLYAKFSIKKYDVTATGTKATVTGTGSFYYGKEVTLTATPDTGYHITKWDGAANTSTTKEVTVNATSNAHTVTAEANTYTVTLNTAEESATTAGTTSVSATYDATLGTVTTTAEKTGYTLQGYYTDKNGSGSMVYGSTGAVVKNVSGYTDANGKWIHDGDVTLYAHFTANIVTVTVYKDGTAYTDKDVDIRLYSGSTSQYDLTKASGTATYSASGITAGTYDIYALNKVDGTLEDTNLDITVPTSSTATVDYYTLTLSVGDNISSVTGDGIYLKNQSATIVATPTAGYTFDSWTGSSTINTASANVTMDAAKSYTANAAAGVYAISLTLEANAESGLTDNGTTGIYEKYADGYYLEQACTSKMTTSENGITIPERTGYAFAGYYTNAENGTQYIDASGKLTSSASATAFKAAGTLYAHWTANTVTITVNNDGEAYTGQTVTLKQSSTVKYTLTEASGVYSKSVITNGTYDVYVGATKAGSVTVNNNSQAETYNFYTVTVNKDTHTSNASANITVALAGTEITLSATQNTGYEFDSWAEATDGVSITNNKFNMPAKAVSVKATAKAKNYTVTLDKQSGTDGDSSITATYDSAMPAAAMPTRNGYTFNGYYSQTDGKGTQYYDADGKSAHIWDIDATDTSLYAYWTINTYTITYELNGGTNDSANPDSYKVTDSNITLKDAAKTNYKFLGWYTDSGFADASKIETIVTSDAADITLYAKFELDVANYTVEHYYMNADGTYPTTTTDKETKSGTISQLTNATAKSVNADEYVAQSITQQTINSDGSTVVKVNYARVQYNVTYSVDGKSEAPTQYYWGAQVSVAENRTKTGNNFSGWTVTGATPSEGKFTMPKSDVTISGTFTEKTFNVTYACGTYGSGTMTDESNVKYFTGHTVAANGFTATPGYTFANYKDADENTYKPGDVIKERDTDIILTAQWTADTNRPIIIKYFLQDYADTGSYTENTAAKAEDKGTTAETYTVTGDYLKTFDGYTRVTTSASELAKTVNGSADTVFNIYYNRDTDYKVTWYDEDGETVLKTDTGLRNGYTPNYGEPPTKAADSTYTYTFKEWLPAITAVTGATKSYTYTAQYNSEKINYTFTFNDWNGNLIEAKNGNYGDSVTAPDVPTSTLRTFKAWNTAVPTTFDGNKTFTATYQYGTEDIPTGSAVVEFKVDGVVTYHEFVALNSAVKNAPEGKDKTVGNVISKFKSWSSSTTSVTGDTVFTPVYEVVDYTAYVNILESLKGENVPDNIQTKLDEIEKDKKDASKTQNDLDAQISTINGLITDNTFTIQFKNYDESDLQSVNVLSGNAPEYTEATPTKASADSDKAYRFKGWNTAVDGTGTGIVAVTAAATYYAQFDEIDYSGFNAIKGKLDAQSLTDLDEQIKAIENGKGTDTQEQVTDKITSFAALLYTVTYAAVNTNGTVEFKEVKVKKNNSISVGTTATANDGYKLDGWYIGETRYETNATYNVTADTTFTAKFVIDNNQWATVTYLAGDHGTFAENAVTSKKVLKNTDYNTDWQPTVNAATGYSFAEWDNVPELKVTADVTITAQWTEHTYSIVFKGNESDGGATESKNNVKYTDNVTLTNGFTKTGYHFIGWSKTAAGDVEYVNNATVSKLTADDKGSVELYAKWVINESTLTINPNGGKWDDKTEEQSFKGSYGSTKAIAVPTRDYYTFDKWTFTKCEDNTSTMSVLNAAATYTYGTSNGGTDTLEAGWKPVDYTITIDYAGGALSGSDTNLGKYNIENEAITLKNPARAGYTFKGWTGTGLDEATTTVTIPAGSYGNRSYTATWQANDNTAYRVEHYVMDTDGNYPTDGNPTKTDNRNGTTDTTLVLDELVTYGGQAVENGIAYDHGFASEVINGNEETVVKLYYVRKQHEFKAVKGTGIKSVTGTKTYYYGQAITAPTATPADGYENEVWDAIIPSTMGTTDITLTANATPIKYTLTYDGNGATSGVPADVTYNVTEEITFAEAPTYENHSFRGWKVATAVGNWEADKVYKAGGKTTLRFGNVTVTAQWVDYKAYNDLLAKLPYDKDSDSVPEDIKAEITKIESGYNTDTQEQVNTKVTALENAIKANTVTVTYKTNANDTTNDVTTSTATIILPKDADATKVNELIGENATIEKTYRDGDYDCEVKEWSYDATKMEAEENVDKVEKNFVSANYGTENTGFKGAEAAATSIAAGNNLTKAVTDKIAELEAAGYNGDNKWGRTNQSKVDDAETALENYLASLDKNNDDIIDDEYLKVDISAYEQAITDYTNKITEKTEAGDTALTSIIEAYTAATESVKDINEDTAKKVGETDNQQLLKTATDIITELIAKLDSGEGLKVRYDAYTDAVKAIADAEKTLEKGQTVKSETLEEIAKLKEEIEDMQKNSELAKLEKNGDEAVDNQNAVEEIAKKLTEIATGITNKTLDNAGYDGINEQLDKYDKLAEGVDVIKSVADEIDGVKQALKVIQKAVKDGGTAAEYQPQVDELEEQVATLLSKISIDENGKMVINKDNRYADYFELNTLLKNKRVTDVQLNDEVLPSVRYKIQDIIDSAYSETGEKLTLTYQATVDKAQKELDEYVDTLYSEGNIKRDKLKKYVIKYINWDKTELVFEKYVKGETLAAFENEARAKAERDNCIFYGWVEVDENGKALNKSGKAAEEDREYYGITIYKAVFKLKQTDTVIGEDEYVVTFFNELKTTILQQVTVAKGGTAVYTNATPVKSGFTADNSKHFIFNKWNNGLTNITADKEVLPLFSVVKHTYSMPTDSDVVWTVDGTNASCKATYKCSYAECGYSTVVEHKSIAYDTVKEATCVSKGKIKFSTTFTLKEVSKISADANTKYTATQNADTPIAPANHTNIITVDAVKPTCKIAGTYKYTYCDDCKQLLTHTDENGEVINHSGITVGTTAANDVVTWTDENAHSWGTWSQIVGTKTHTKYCKNDGCDKTLIEDCTGTVVSCTENTLCDACGGVFRAATEHTWENVPEKAATCTTDGYVAYQKCSVCFTINGEIQTIGKLGHSSDYKLNSEKSGTATDETYSWDYYECKNGCGDYYMLVKIVARDVDGNPMPNANVTVSGNGINVSGGTDENGIFAPDCKLKEGEYTVSISGKDADGDTATANGTIKIGGGKVSGSFGRVRVPGKYYCSMCPIKEKWKNKPVIGWIVIAVHFFYHYISYIVNLFS